MIEPVLISMLRRPEAEQIDIFGIQDPIVDFGRFLLSRFEGKSLSELNSEGYKPVSSVGLLWEKESDNVVREC